MAQKVPPPPPIANQDQAFNRWLLELTAILNDGGGIDSNSVVGLPEVIVQSAGNAADITALQSTTSGQGADITGLQSNVVALQNDVTTLQGGISTINGQITSLGARAQVLNGVGVPNAGLGNVNDWYANIGGAVGARIYIKTGVATWTAFPF